MVRDTSPRSIVVPFWLLALLLAACPSSAGKIESVDGKTIIHVDLWSLPDPNNPDTFTRAEVAGVELFVSRFPEIFAHRYRDRYRANPEKYGDFNWDEVEVRLHRTTGINVEGVEVDLLQIAGDMAPDILYVNFRKSDNYIQAGFLAPLDRIEDAYIGDLSRATFGAEGIERPPGDGAGSMSDEELN